MSSRVRLTFQADPLIPYLLNWYVGEVIRRTMEFCYLSMYLY